MQEVAGQEKSRLTISLETGSMLRYGAIMLASFLVTLVVTWLARGMFNGGLSVTILLAAVLFTSLFFAVRFAKGHVSWYVEQYGWLVIPPALAALFLTSSMKPVAFVLLFIIHSLACLFLRTLKNTARLGIELIMLITILGSFAYGAKTGALLGATAMLMDYALSARFSYFVPLTTAAYVLIGLVAGSFSPLGITTVGIWAAVAYNLVTSVIIVGLMGGHLDKCLRFGLSNIALNAFLFTTIAPRLLSIVT